MIYRLLADGAWLLYLAFIVFVVAGGLFLLRWPCLSWWLSLHLPAGLWGWASNRAATSARLPCRRTGCGSWAARPAMRAASSSTISCRSSIPLA